MRVMFIITRAEPLGGAQVHVRDLALALKCHSHDIHVIVGNDGQILHDLTKSGICVHIMNHLVRPIRPLSDARAFFELKRKISQVKPDLISAHSSKAGWIARLAGRSKNTPTLFTAHGWAFSEGLPKLNRVVYLWAEKAMASFSDLVLTVSHYDRNLAINKKVLQPDRIIVIHNGMPDKGISAIATPKRQPPTIVMVARFMKQKNHSTLLHALSRLQDLDWRVQFIGAGPLESTVRVLSNNLGIFDRVEFLGQRDDIDRILANAQIFVLTSNWEGLNRSTIEALHAGLPCVVSDVGGMNELVSDGVEGYLVPRNDAQTLTDRLKTLIENPHLRAQFGKAARERYEREFQFDQMFEKTLNVYDMLLRRHASGI